MTKRMTSSPEQTSVICVQLLGRETGLVRGEMLRVSGGSSNVQTGPDFSGIMDLIDDIASEWWASW